MTEASSVSVAEFGQVVLSSRPNDPKVASRGLRLCLYNDLESSETRWLVTRPDVSSGDLGDEIESLLPRLHPIGDAEVVRSFTGIRRTVVASANPPERLASGSTLFIVELTPGAQWVDAFRDWLDGEHFERQSELLEVDRVTGYESLDGPTTFVNVWEVSDLAIIDSPAWLAKRDTAWFEDIKPAFSSGPFRRARLMADGS